MRALRAKIAVLMLSCAAALPAAAADLDDAPRTLEIAPFAGFFWSSQVATSSGPVAFSPTADAGLTLGFPVDEKSQVEVLYVFARPQARFDSTSPAYASTPWFGVTTQYLQVGGTVNFSATERVEPFFGGGLGLAWFSPSDVAAQGSPTLQPADTWLFAFNLGLGVKWFLSRAVGIRAEARVLMPVYFASGAFLSGPNGAALTVNAGIPLVQGDLSVALVLSP